MTAKCRQVIPSHSQLQSPCQQSKQDSRDKDDRNPWGHFQHCIAHGARSPRRPAWCASTVLRAALWRSRARKAQKLGGKAPKIPTRSTAEPCRVFWKARARPACHRCRPLRLGTFEELMALRCSKGRRRRKLNGADGPVRAFLEAEPAESQANRFAKGQVDSRR